MKLPVFAVALLSAFSLQAVAQSDGPIEVGARTCKSGLFQHVTFKDPESVRIGAVTGGQMEVVEYAGTKIAARKFYVAVNAKNSMGGYIGEKPVICITSEDGQRILSMTPLF